jgi:hypothetical protein
MLLRIGFMLSHNDSGLILQRLVTKKKMNKTQFDTRNYQSIRVFTEEVGTEIDREFVTEVHLGQIEKMSRRRLDWRPSSCRDSLASLLHR